MSTCPGNMLYMPPEALQSYPRETSDNFDKLDVFSFGVLMLRVYTQQLPLPTALYDRQNKPKTEIQRRLHLLNEVEDDAMKQLAMECLHNTPESRPHTRDLVKRINQLQPRVNTCTNRLDKSKCIYILAYIHIYILQEYI